MLDLSVSWHFKRPKLTQALATKLVDRQRIAMFGARQKGKTTLLREELIPRLVARGVLPIYIECWADRKDPMGSINHALSKSLEELKLAPGHVGRRLARTPVRKLGAFGASTELGDVGRRKLPKSPTLRFDALLTQVLEATTHDVALLFDEFQAVAEVDESKTLSAGLRAALTQANHRVGVVFSGSSQTQLLRMFTTSKAPLYQFANAEPYPLLKEDFVSHVAQKFHEATRRELNQALALRLLEDFGHQPGPFLHVLAIMVSDPAIKLDKAFTSMLNAKSRTLWTVAWNELMPTQRVALRLVADKQAPTSAASLDMAAQQLGKLRVASSTMDRALKALEAKGLVQKDGSYGVVDPVLNAWLLHNAKLPVNGA